MARVLPRTMVDVANPLGLRTPTAAPDGWPRPPPSSCRTLWCAVSFELPLMLLYALVAGSALEDGVEAATAFVERPQAHAVGDWPRFDR